MLAPLVALTVATPVSEVTVNGPTQVPAGPLWLVEVTVSVGGVGAGCGPAARTLLTIVATAE
jgi:hypothetical protein